MDFEMGDRVLEVQFAAAGSESAIVDFAVIVLSAVLGTVRTVRAEKNAGKLEGCERALCQGHVRWRASRSARCKLGAG